MKSWLIALLPAVCGAVLPLFVGGAHHDEDLSMLHERRAQVLDEIASLERASVLPEVNQNWHQLRRYVALYEGLLLAPADAKVKTESALKTDSWRGVLSGDVEQLMAAARRMQGLVPVYFNYFSLNGQAKEPAAKLSVQVLGRTD